MRILHLISSNFVGGPERQILHHARSMTTPDLEIWIGSFRDGRKRPEILEQAADQGLPTLELSFEISSGHFNPFGLGRLAAKMRRGEFDLICTHGYKSNVIGYLLSRIGGCPQAGFVRGWIAENPRVEHYERLDRWVLSRTDWAVCVSELQAQALRPRRRRRRPPLVIPNAALFPRMARESVDRAAIRRQLSLQEDLFWIGAVGRLSIEKGHAILLEAVAKLEMPELRLAILGAGPERAALEERAKSPDLDGRIHFAGWCRDVQPWMQAFDLLVNPSFTEGLPNVVLEAMALGTPVIATAVGGVAELLGNNEFGIAVPPGDAVALADAVRDLASHPERALRLSRQASRRLEDYSPEKHNQLLLELYLNALASGGTRHGKTIHPASSVQESSGASSGGNAAALTTRKPGDGPALEYPRT